MSTITIHVDFHVGKTDLVPHPERACLNVRSSVGGWEFVPDHKIPQVEGEPGHFKGSVELSEGAEFRLRLENRNPMNPGLAHMAGGYWFSLEGYPIASNGKNNIACSA